MEQLTQTADVLTTLSNQLADAVERIAPALVLVNGRQRHPASGVVFAPDLVLTADHVLEREDDLTVGTHDGRTLPAQFVGRDPSTDLAVLRVADLNVAPAPAADGTARVGQMVLAVGRPGEDGPLASAGIVSSVGGPLRSRGGIALDRYIQTDATPYPGFSGGPLIDAAGAVLGILTTGLANGAALAVPSEIAWRTAQTLTQHGQIKRGYLGVSSQPVQLPAGQQGGRAQEQGLLVVRVEDGGPAAAAGLLIGDILVGVDGQAIQETDDLLVLLTAERVGKTVPVEVIRGGALQTLQLTVGQRS